MSHKPLFEEGLALGLYDMVRDEWVFYTKEGEVKVKHPPKTWTDPRARYFHICHAKDIQPS